MSGARVGWPSASFPAFPPASVELPVGWVPFVQGGAVFGAHHPDPSDGFAANVLVTVERWPVVATAADSLTVLRSRLAQAGARELLVEDAPADPEGVYVETAQREPRLGGLLVVYRTAVVAHGGVTDAYTAIGTATDGQAATIGGELRAMVKGLRLTAP